jgi:hypothetical protein
MAMIAERFDPVIAGLFPVPGRDNCPPSCECVICQESFNTIEAQDSATLLYKYLNKISNADARDVGARDVGDWYVREAQVDRGCIQRRLSSHGDTVLKKWKKMSQEKRRTLLWSAGPNLYKHQWLVPTHA